MCLTRLGDVPKVLSARSEHSSSVEALVVLETLPYLASAALDGTVRVWDLHATRPRLTLTHTEGVVRVVADATGQLLVTATLDGRVTVWDTRTGAQVAQQEGHTTNILDLVMMANGTALTGAEDGTARLWRVR